MSEEKQARMLGLELGKYKALQTDPLLTSSDNSVDFDDSQSDSVTFSNDSFFNFNQNERRRSVSEVR